ncbi:hypothetical protein Pelo_4155 [Pelomyxa schiedti]|nr:hypothetical protein Pelo_4155 [Pelomyxa schiedti]
MATTTTKSRNGPRVGPKEWFRAAHGGDTDALRRLLAGDRDLLNSVNDERQRVTALHAATWGGKPRCVEFLLSMNIDVNSQGMPGDTALHLACRKGNVEIVKQLVGTGTTNIKNTEGKTPVEYSQNDEMRQLFQSVWSTIPVATTTKTTTQKVPTPKTAQLHPPASATPPMSQPPIAITTLEQLHNLVAHDLLSSFPLPPPNKPSSSPPPPPLKTPPSTVLSKAAEDGINNLGKQGTTVEASVLMLVTDQLSQTLSTLLDQQKVHQGNAEKVAVQVEVTGNQVEQAQAQVQELERKLAQARQLLGATTQANTLAKKQLDESRELTATITRNISMVHEKQEALERKLASVRKVLSSLSQKASTRNLLQFNVEDIGCLLCDLGLQKHADKFSLNEVDGEVFLELNKAGLEELGVTQRAEQDLLYHTRAMITHCGAIRAPSASDAGGTDAAASWDVNEVASWLESQGIPPQAITWFREMGITGISLLYMEAQEISSVPGLPFGPRHKLLKRIGELKSAVYTPRNPRAPSSSGPGHTAAAPSSIPLAVPAPLEFLCPITCDLMNTPVVAADGYCYEKTAIEEWLRKHNTSPMTNAALSSKALVACHTLRSVILDWKKANNIP